MAAGKKRTLEDLLDEYEKLSQRRSELREEILKTRQEGSIDASSPPSPNDQVIEVRGLEAKVSLMGS